MKTVPVKTVPVFGGNAVNLRGNEVFLKAPSGRELSSKMTEGERVTMDFSSLPKACGCSSCFDYKI